MKKRIVVGLLTAWLGSSAWVSAQVDCSGCALSFDVPHDTIDVSCGADIPTPAFPSYTTTCNYPVNEALSALYGGGVNGVCGGVTAYGPGADFAIWVNGLTSLGLAPSDYFLTGLVPLQVDDLPNGDVHIVGEVINSADEAFRLQIDVLLDSRVDWNAWEAGGGLAKDPLGTGNFPSWSYLLLNSFASTISGVPGTATEGWMMELAHNPGSQVYGFQLGTGANTHNLNDGLGGWFSWAMTIGGEDYASVGDLIVDLTSCVPASWNACAGEDLVYRYTISDGCSMDTAWVVLKLVDDVAPIFSDCPEPDTILCSEPLPVFTPHVSDNCSEFVLASDTTWTPDDCSASTGTLSIVFTATDSCGNASSCESIIVIENSVPLHFVTPLSDMTVECSDWAECETFELPVALSGCSGDTADVACEVIYLDCDSMPSVFDALMVYTATSDCGEEITDTIAVNVVDNTPPYFTWTPPDLTISIEDWEDFTVELPVCVDDCYVPNLDCETGWGGGGGGILPCDYNSTITPLCCGGFEVVYHFFHYDLAGNMAEWYTTITVIDDLPPTFATFPGDTTLACDNLDFLDLPGNGIVLDDNSCPIDSLFLSHTDSIVTGVCSGQFTILRNFTASDNCGNASDSVWTVSVVDTVAPVFTDVPDSLNIVCGQLAPMDSAMAEDACSDVILEDSLFWVAGGADDCDLFGIYERRWYATDACGNVDSISQYISVLDTLPLHFVTPLNDATIECSDWAECETFELPIAVSGCSGDTADVTCEVIYVDCDSMPSVFDALMVYTATSDCGEEITDTIAVNVVDNTPPYFTWTPPNLTMTLEDWESFTVELPVCVDDCYVPDLNCETGWDGEGGGILPCDYDSTITNLCCGSFELVYHFFHFDLAGNMAEWFTTITVIDNTPPTFENFPGDTTLACDDLAFLDIPGNGIVLDDNSCPVDSLFLSHTDSIVGGACSGQYTILRNFTAADNCGNEADSVWTISVIDTVAPVFAYVPDSLNIVCGQLVPMDSAMAVDACSDIILEDSLFWLAGAANDCDLFGMYERRWYAIDACGNVDSVSQFISVLDTTPMYFSSIPDSATVTCSDWAECETLPMPTAFAGGCTGDTLEVACTVHYLECLNYPAEFSASLVYTTENACGDMIVDSTVVVVIDTVAPYFTWVPPNDTLTLEEYEGWTPNLPVCVDDCYYPELECGEPSGIGPGIIECDYDSTLTELCCGGFELVYHFFHYDLANNMAEWFTTITVIDDQPPTFVSFPNDTTLSCGDPNLELVLNDTLLILTDNSCDLAELTLTHTDSIVDGCGATFELIRTFVATDACGNAAIGVWNMSVVDTIGPSFDSVEPDLLLACTDSVPACDPSLFVASDPCSAVDLWCDGDAIVDQICPNAYDLERRIGAQDACGNTTIYIQQIAVRDTLAPEIVTYPQDTSISCDVNLPAVNLSDFTAEDNCSAESGLVYSLLNESNSGDDCINFVTRLFDVEDECGNHRQFSQLITVQDTTPPVFTEILEADTFVCGDLVPPCTEAFLGYTDNCNGVSWTCSDSIVSGDCSLDECLIERTFTLIDDCGNEASAVQNLVVSEVFIDAQMPTGISPNGDLINDTYVIQNIDPEAGILPCAWSDVNEIVIFNRWGNEVYREVNYRNGWEGVNSNGEPLPEGTYFVVFTMDGKQYSSYVDLRR